MTWSPQNAMTRSEISAFLDEPHIARLATIRKDGSPHVSPVWYSWDGKSLFVVLGETRLHTANIRRDSRVSVIVDEDERPKKQTLRVGAKGVLVNGQARLVKDSTLLDKVVKMNLERYLGKDNKEYSKLVHAEKRVVMKLKPLKIRAWDFSKQIQD